jgi:hypothetical protein
MVKTLLIEVANATIILKTPAAKKASAAVFPIKFNQPVVYAIKGAHFGGAIRALQ